MSFDPSPSEGNWLGRLSDQSAAKVISQAFVDDDARLPESRLRKEASYPFPQEPRWATDDLIPLLEEAVDRHKDDRPAAMDAWLAPRLHSTLRMTRAEATDNQLWNYIGLVVAPDFIRRRWGKPHADGRRPVGQSGRFNGPWHIQCFSRLWWTAELFRNGDDYGPVVTAAGNQDVINTVLRQDMINHRPAAQALVRLAAAGTVKTGREVNALAQAARLASSTVVYEVTAPDDPGDRDRDALQAWIESPDAVFWSRDKLPRGPLDGRVQESSVQWLASWFEELFRTAPVRGREVGEESAATV